MPATKKRLINRCFPMKFIKFFRNTSFFTEHLQWLAAFEFYFGEEQIYIHTLVLKVLRLDLMRTVESRKQKIRRHIRHTRHTLKLGTLQMYIYCLKE